MRYFILTIFICGCMSLDTTKSYAQVTNGLVAKYSFNGGDANDEVGDNDGVVNGATLTADRFGNIDHAYHFDGVTNYIDFGDSSEFNFGAGSFSISLWIKPSTGNDNNVVLGKMNGQSANGYSQYAIWVNDDNTGSSPDGLRATCFSGSGGTFGSTHLDFGTNDVSTTDWTHVVLILDIQNGQSALYRNNVPINGHDINSIPNGWPGLEIDGFPLQAGKKSWASNSFYKGDLDDIRIYDRALTGSEVETLYNEENPNLASGVDDIQSINQFAVYPNPTLDNIMIVNGPEDIERMSIVDMAGRITDLSYSGGNRPIDISFLTEGIYMLQIQTPEETLQRRFIKAY